MAHSAWTGGSVYTGQAALPHKNIHIGCVSVDIIFSKITDMIDSMVVGEAGSAVLVNEDGIYLAGVSEDKIQGAVNIADDYK